MVDFVPRGEFVQLRDVVYSRLDTHWKEIEKLRDAQHKIANLVSSLQYVDQMLKTTMDDLKNVPRKEDLDYVTKSMQTGFSTLNDERLASERRLTRTISIVGIAVTIIIAAVTVALKFVKAG